MNKLQAHIASIELQLSANLWLKALLLNVSIALILGIWWENETWKSVVTGAGTVIIAMALGAFRSQRKKAVQVVHQQAGNMEFSLELLDKKELNIAEQLQVSRILKQIPQKISVWGIGLWPFLVGFAGSALLSYAIPYLSHSNPTPLISTSQLNELAQVVSNPANLPILQSAQVQIQSPPYTGIPSKTESNLNIKALKGSRIKWELNFQNGDELEVFLVNSGNEKLLFQANSGIFSLQEQLLGSGIYSIQAYRKGEAVFQSEFYTLEAVEDLSPVIEPDEKETYKFFFPGNNPKIPLKAQISDDFRVQEVVIVATLARGRGENVKFRETQIPVENRPFQKKSSELVLDLSGMDFQPGDELYYYWSARDNKQPEANFSRSDTYFIKYFDENDDSEEAFAGMAINVLPDYFRSQRQIIIDTEKLIAERKKKSEKDFNFTSNEIGYDQKLLRLRYGQYLGEEFESDAGGGTIEGQEGDLLSGYMHLHDQEGEHDPDFKIEEEGHEGHEGHDHGEEEGNTGGGIENLLADYMHAHDSEEMNTYFEKSTRGALKSALEQMWQAELYLRLFEPEKSLPYQYKALEMLKTVQQKSRVYIKRTGYDPPPIKEDEIRLNGKLEELGNRLEKELAELEAQIEPLASEVLGLLLKQELYAAEREKVNQLGQLWSARIQNSGMEDWSVLLALQELEAGKLDEKGRTLLREKLYPLAKNYKNTGPSQLSNQALKSAFLKKNQ
ncbi:hypothetical protein [Algoriphagus taiwanensis]|uniref:Tryptophan-rich sensory protein n=1 Tax=Algoriphagus taiwanensis TaxID=1445656 RepID=A0ABQ6Q670_9BACT|nr:hypothetical protein Ataiwa_32610 [Algoriphagus taiwanensis]